MWFCLLGLCIQRLCWSGLRGQWLHGELVLVYFISGTIEDEIVVCGCIEEESREGFLDSILLLGSRLSNSLRAQSLPSVYLTQWHVVCSSLWYLALLAVPFTRGYECRRWPETSSKLCTCESRSSVWPIMEPDWMRNVSRGTIPGFGFEHLRVICQHVQLLFCFLMCTCPALFEESVAAAIWPVLALKYTVSAWLNSKSICKPGISQPLDFLPLFLLFSHRMYLGDFRGCIYYLHINHEVFSF